MGINESKHLKEPTREEIATNIRPRVLANKSFNKIFCVGYNKTGTTTLESVLSQYGYNLPNVAEQEIRLTKNVFRANYVAFIEFVSKYDAFQDLPFSQGLTFVAADALFPCSKFILTIRNSDDWFRSLTSFHSKLYGVDTSRVTEQDIRQKFNYLYKDYSYENKKRLLSIFDEHGQAEDWSKLYDKNWYVREYESRNTLIKKYFKSAPEKLLVIDVTQEKTTEKICKFLDIPEDFVRVMPHENKTATN